MTGGLQTTGQRFTDRHAAPTATETDTQNTYSQQENGMSNHQSMTSVPRPAWATHSRIDEESPATVYHAHGFEVADPWTEQGRDTVTVEVYVQDAVVLTDDGDAEYRRHEPLVHIVGGIVTLAAAAEFADALVTALTLTIADDENREVLERALASVENLKSEVRDHQPPVPGQDVPADVYRNLSRCDHGLNKHEGCAECRAEQAAARKAGA